MSKTQENLGSAFAGESQANRKYLAFSRKAEDEGLKGLAKIFRMAAEGETIHALNHFSALGSIKNSKENLQAAIEGETYEIEKMYPQFLSETEENEGSAKMSFNRAKRVEEVHQKLFQEAIEKLENGQEVPEKAYFVCAVCGFPAEGEAPGICPVCGAPREKFTQVI